jgi:DNA-binding MarR family transcriptional regulator
MSDQKPSILIEASKPVLRVYTPLADEIGLSPSIALMQFDFWMNNGEGCFEDGHWWISMSVREMQRRGFSFWCISTINRNIAKLEEKGLIVTITPEDEEQPRKIRFNLEGMAKLESVKLGGVLQNDTPLLQNATQRDLKDSLSQAHAHIETPVTTWQIAFEKHIGLATARDVDFFADLLKTHDPDDVTYAIVEASKLDPNIKNHAHQGIQQALDALERSRGVKVKGELEYGIKTLIHGNGNHANILRAAKALGTLENLTIFKAFWEQANPIGKPDQRPHASQVEAYLPQALEWHAKQKPASATDGIPSPQAKRTTEDCAECDPRYGNRGAIGNGFFEFAGTKYHCPFCWQGVYDHPTAMQGKIADLMRGVSK